MSRGFKVPQFFLILFRVPSFSSLLQRLQRIRDLHVTSSAFFHRFFPQCNRIALQLSIANQIGKITGTFWILGIQINLCKALYLNQSL